MQNKVNGNTDGIKNILLDRIATIYDLRMLQYEFASYELLSLMSEFTQIIGREISVYISRDGRVVDVSIGDSSTVSMPSMRLVRNEDRLCGVRCIHTHPNGDGRLSGVDLGTLRSMRLDSMVAIGVIDGKPNNLYAAYLGELSDDERQVLIYGPMSPKKLPQQALLDEINASDDRFRSTTKDVTQAEPERAILVGIENNEGYDTLSELAELAKTAGANVVGKIIQKRKVIDNATYIGSGKAEELSLKASELEADLIIFDDELNAIQLRNLEDASGCRVIDRTTLILDIFASRAQSREGKLQVELAQIKYMQTRLTGKGIALSRQGGGIGARGVGEKKLEIDRRRMKRRIYELEQEIAEIEKQRGLRRERREKNPIPLVALVGYTNAGKSTLLNTISNSDVLAEDKLFATLDPVVRQVTLKNGTNVLFSDTVGFINKLPHDLVQAFRSTLDEVEKADLILHVVDCSSSYYDSQMRVVEDVLTSLEAIDTPRIDVYNKVDKENAHPLQRGNFAFISAKNGTGIEELLDKVEVMLNSARTKVELLVPYSKYDVISLIRNYGQIISEKHESDGTKIEAFLDESSMWKIKKLLEK